MNTKQRLQKAIEYNEQLGEKLDSPTMKHGILISTNEAKDYLRLLEQEPELKKLIITLLNVKFQRKT